MVRSILFFGSICAAALFVSLTVNGESLSDETLNKYLDGMFEHAAPEWKSRIAQDETQRLCSRYRNDPPVLEADNILAREKASVVFPADGRVVGDGKAGVEVAENGRGGQFSDGPDTIRGGNCYACHQLSPTEESYGTLGPSLLAYGKNRGYSAEEAKATYAKVYNAQSVTVCSQMPRFGIHKVLSEQRMKDVVAYLFDPQSPVNK